MPSPSTPAPSRAEIEAQTARETQRRSRLAVPAFAGGILYLLSGIIISQTLSGGPTVGLLQGLEPALSGVAKPRVSPRAAEVKFASHHAFGLIVGSVVASIAIIALTLILLALLDATRFRRPQTWGGIPPLVLAGGIALALVSLGHQIVAAIVAHSFAVGHDFSDHAVENVLSTGPAVVTFEYLGLLATLLFVGGMIPVALNAMRVGLLPRWMGFLGMFSAVLILLPGLAQELEIVPAFWMAMIGVLFVGKWPNGEPPAWAAGQARPWPSQGRMRAARREGVPVPVLSAGTADLTPAPVAPVPKGSARKRRRKRGGGR